jgi:hypothetical protein
MKIKFGKNIIFYSIMFLTIIILSITLFFPISTDLSIFLFGGQTIAEGKKIYVDYLDIKPPLVYYIYSLVYNLFGFDEFKIRIIDYIYQIFTLLSLFVLVKEIHKSNLIASLSCLIYSVLYTNLTYGSTFQVESLISLPLLWIIYFMKNLEEIKTIRLLYVGLLVGIIICLKFTFAIIIFPLLLQIIIHHNTLKQKVFIIFKLSLAIIIGIIIGLLPLIDQDILTGFKEIMALLYKYSKLPPFSVELIQRELTWVYIYISNRISILLFLIFCLSFLSLAQFRLKDKLSSNAIVYFNSLFLTVFLLLSVVIEKKLFPYHYSRMYGTFVILLSYGIFNIKEIIQNSNRSRNEILTIILAVIIPFAYIFSPIRETVELAKLPYYYFKSNDEFNKINEDSTTQNIRKETFHNIANYINSDLKKGEKIIVLPPAANEILFYTTNTKKSKFGHFLYYLGVASTEKWQKEFVEESIESNYIIVSRADSNINDLISGMKMSTFDAIKTLPTMDSIIENHFYIGYEFRGFVVYKKRDIQKQFLIN